MNRDALIHVERYSEEHRELLDLFCAQCKELGYDNNSSFQKMKIGDKSLSPTFWIARVGKQIFAISGIHPINAREYRVAFRSCYLPLTNSPFKSTFSKKWWNYSFIFNYILPLQIKELQIQKMDMFMTTNVAEKGEPLSKLNIVNNKLLPILSNTGAIQYIETKEYFGCRQKFWKIEPLTLLDLVKKNFSNRRNNVAYPHEPTHDHFLL